MRSLFALIAAIGAAFWTYEIWKGQTMTDQEKDDMAVDILARTLWGEARNQGRTGMEAVASAVLNRVKVAQRRGGYWWGNTVTEVCLKEYQFSCWNANDPNRPLLDLVDASDSVFRVALDIAQDAVSGDLTSTVGSATHYHTKAVSPSWKDAGTHVASLGDHDFYTGIA